MNNGRPIEEASSAVGAHVVNLTSDLLTLAELQSQLFVIDVRETFHQASKPALVAGAGACLLLGAIPLLLAGLVETLAERTDLTWEGACWLVSTGGILCAALAIGYGLLKIRRACRVLDRSQAELRENLRWIKKVVQQATAPDQR
jgi:hypothetical protein